MELFAGDSDLMRRYQAACERMVEAARHVEPEEAAILRAVYGKGVPPQTLAQAMQRDPRTFRAQMRRLVRRVTSPVFRRVVAEHNKWPTPRKQVAREVFLRGHSQRSAARRLGMSIHEVRRECIVILAMVYAGEACA